MIRSLTALVCAFALPGTAIAGDAYITQQGRLLDTVGQPITGTHAVEVTLYTAADGTGDVWQSSFATVAFSDGYYAIPLTGDDDDPTPRSLDEALANGPLYLGLSIDTGDELTPRPRVGNAGAASSGSGVGTTTDSTGDACGTAGEFAWSTTDQGFLGCTGAQWFLLGSAPTGSHRYWRVRLVENDGSLDNYLGGFTVFSGANGSGTNFGSLAGPSAVTVFGTNRDVGSIWDPIHTSQFTTLASTTSTTGGRVQCKNGVFATGNCWVQIDLGTPQQIASWGILSRQNASTAHWTGVLLEASNDAGTWTTIDTRLGLTPGQAEPFVWDVTANVGPAGIGSCREHLIADPSLAGQDGPYLIDTTGDGATDLTVHCDMTRDGGGWTLVMQGYHGTNSSLSNAQWHTTGSINGSALAAGESLAGLTETAKLSDAVIDGIAADGNATDVARFRIEDNHGNSNSDYGQFFIPQSCSYVHTAPAVNQTGCSTWNRSPDFSGDGGTSSPSSVYRGIAITGSGAGFPGTTPFVANYDSGTYKKWIIDNRHDEDPDQAVMNWQMWVR